MRAYIAARHGPVADDNVLRVPRVRPVGVDRLPLRVARGVHVQVRHGHVLRVCDEGMPELRLSPGDAVDVDVRPPPHREGYRPSVLVRAVPVLVDPRLPVAVEQRLPVPPHGDVVAAEQPGRRPPRVGDAVGRPQPVGDVVGGPDELAEDADVAVGEVRRVHDLPDVECALGEDDGAVLAAFLEGVEDLRRVVDCRGEVAL